MGHDRELHRPKVLTLCGSTRFAEDMNELAVEYTERGWIVLRPEVVTYDPDVDPQHHDPALKARMDVLHFAKIDMSDRVVIVNRDGYIGESTRREEEYALMRRVDVSYAFEKLVDHDGWQRRPVSGRG